MRDANLVTVMQAQCQRKVGLIDYRTVAAGVEAIQARIADLKAQDVGIAIVDAVSNDDLMRLGLAVANLPLITAGSGVAIGLPQNFGIQNTGTSATNAATSSATRAATLPMAKGWQAVVSGSCSQATNAQVATWQTSGRPHRALNLAAVLGGEELFNSEVQRVLSWAKTLLTTEPVLIYSTAQADSVKNTQAGLGSDATGARIEQALSAIAKGLVSLKKSEEVLLLKLPFDPIPLRDMFARRGFSSWAEERKAGVWFIYFYRPMALAKAVAHFPVGHKVFAKTAGAFA